MSNRFSPKSNRYEIGIFGRQKKNDDQFKGPVKESRKMWACDSPELELLQRSLPPRLQRMFPLHFESPSLMAAADVDDEDLVVRTWQRYHVRFDFRSMKFRSVLLQHTKQVSDFLHIKWLSGEWISFCCVRFFFFSFNLILFITHNWRVFRHCLMGFVSREQEEAWLKY